LSLSVVTSATQDVISQR